MNAQELFEKYSTWRTTREFRNMMDEDQFIQALAEAIEGGHLQPIVSQCASTSTKSKTLGVDIGKKDFDDHDSYEDDWYKCPECNGVNCFRKCRYCPDCGITLNWVGESF